MYMNWGLKVPPVFHLLTPLAEAGIEFKYVHVVRHGLDMAFSSNQNQVRNWGWRFRIEAQDPPTPAECFRYWVLANQQAMAEAAACKIDHVVLNFDDLCAHPREEIGRLMSFAEVSAKHEDSLMQLVQPPSTLRRRDGQDCSFVTPADWEALGAFGFGR